MSPQDAILEGPVVSQKLFLPIPKPTPRVIPKPRSGAIDLIRIIAAFCVVSTHTSDKWYGGSFLLIAISIVLTMRTDRRLELFINRAKRLLVPWLAWCVFYAVLEVRRAITTGTEMEFGWYTILKGTHWHLWTIPFILIALVAGSWALALIRNWIFWLVAAMITVLLRDSVRLFMPSAQWTASIPAVCLGLAYYCAKPVLSNTQRVLWITLGMWIACAIAVLVLRPGTNQWLPSLIGSTLMAFGWLIRFDSRPWLIATANLGFGVYLMHPFIMRYLWPLHLSPLPYALVTFTVTMAVAALISRTRFSWVIGVSPPEKIH